MWSFLCGPCMKLSEGLVGPVHSTVPWSGKSALSPISPPPIGWCPHPKLLVTGPLLPGGHHHPDGHRDGWASSLPRQISHQGIHPSATSGWAILLQSHSHLSWWPECPPILPGEGGESSFIYTRQFPREQGTHRLSPFPLPRPLPSRLEDGRQSLVGGSVLQTLCKPRASCLVHCWPLLSEYRHFVISQVLFSVVGAKLGKICSVSVALLYLR